MFERRDFSATAVEAHLAVDVSTASDSFTLDDATGWPTGGVNGDFMVRIEDEVIRCSSRTGNTCQVAGGGRGYDGTAIANHTATATCEHVLSKVDLYEANIVASETVGKATGPGQILVSDGVNSFTVLPNGGVGVPLLGGVTTPAFGPLATAGYDDDSVTNAKLAPNSVGTTELIDDNVTNAKIAPQAVNVTEIHADLAGDGLVGGAGAPLAVSTGAGLEVSADTVRIAADAAGSGLTGGAGSALAVNPDNSTLEVSADALRVKDGGVTGPKLADNVVDDTTLALVADTLTMKDGGITQAKFASEAGTSWTPTISGTGWAIGSSTVTGLYIKQGRQITAQGIITFAGATFGAGDLTVGGLPIAMNASIAGLGRVFFSDASDPQDYYGDWYVAASATSGVVYPSAWFGDVGYVFRDEVTNGIPMTWANGDSITLSITYIGAS